MTGVCACFPFDTAKTFMQMNPAHAEGGTFGLLSQMIKNNGFFSMYKGIAYPFFGYGCIFSVNFGIKGTTQDILKSTFHQNDEYAALNKGLPPLETMFCGVVAGCGSAVVRTPIERVKVWSQLHKISTVESTRQLMRIGIRDGIFVGLGATMARDAPRFGVYYPIYQVTRWVVDSVLPPNSETGKPTQLAVFLSGGAAGVGCYCTVYPLDVTKTRVQGSPKGTYTGILHVASTIVKESGVRGLYKGLLPTCYRAATLHSCIFLIYENVMDALGSGK